jgi:hypothetical protein
MINNDLLANRLNAFKNNEPIPEVEKNQEHVYQGAQEHMPLIVTIISQIINLGFLFLKSAAYGFAAKTIFSTDWNFMALLAVGFSFELALTTILNTFTKNK